MYPVLTRRNFLTGTAMAAAITVLAGSQFTAAVANAQGSNLRTAAVSGRKTLSWMPERLASIGKAYSIWLTAEVDGRLPNLKVEIGVVAVDGNVYVRAYRGRQSQWYQASAASRRGIIRLDQERIDVEFSHPDMQKDAVLSNRIHAAYRSKYGAIADSTMPERARNATIMISPARDA